MYDKNNIFARIIRGEIPCNKIYEDEKVLAFNDISPAAPKHILVVPKGEYISFADFTAKADAAEIQDFFQRVARIASDNGVKETGYRLITNHGKHAHQTVPHFHVHILGGTELGPLISGDRKIR